MIAATLLKQSIRSCILCLGVLVGVQSGACSDKDQGLTDGGSADSGLIDAAIDALSDLGMGGDLPSGDLPGGDLLGGDLLGPDLPGGDLPSGDLDTPDAGAVGDGSPQFCFFEETGVQVPVGQQKCPCPSCDEVLFCSLGLDNQPKLSMAECMAGMECQENIPGAATCYCNNAADSFCPADVPWGGNCPDDPDCV